MYKTLIYNLASLIWNRSNRLVLLFLIYYALVELAEHSLARQKVNAHGLHVHNSNIGYAISYTKPKLIANVNETQFINRIQSNETFKSTRKKKRSIIADHDDATARVLIALNAFNLKFNLNLKPINNSDFLSPRLDYLNRNNKYSLNDSINNAKISNKKNCFYIGHVNDDRDSIAHINLCHDGHILGSFRVDDNDYFIEPDTTFDHLQSTHEASLNETEFSFIYLNDQILTLQTHIIYKKAFDTTEQNSKESCALLGSNHDSFEEKDYSTSTKRNLNRAKRSLDDHLYVIDQKIYLELLVVVDKKMEEYYGANLENHVLTLLFLTTQMYQHSSIINPVRIYITNIVYLSRLHSSQLKGFNISSNAEDTMSRFCRWQEKFTESKMRKPDAAILITKEDICKSEDVCQTLGMAKLGQVCVKTQNCALIEDSGINTAYTIAHEIGHLLGMKHVDENRCKDFDSRSIQMMASVLDLTKTDYEWSNCSVKELNDFLRQDNARCMFNVPDQNSGNYFNKSLTYQDTLEQFNDEIRLNAIFPGDLQSYNLKQQCQQIFGPESDSCEHNLGADCKVLWCKADIRELDEEDDAIQCATTNSKWADGTPCALNEPYYQFKPAKICINGECVLKTSDEAKIIDGSWSSWGEFSECSRTCGGGVRKRYRTCDNPKPKNGGKYCIGDRVDYESCKTQTCPPGPDFRDLQCELAAMKTSEQRILKLSGFEGINPKSWKAFHSQDSRRKCTLFCKPEDRSNFAVLSPHVIDGTKCSSDSHDICVNGFCLPGGCDNILNSTKKNDNCGVCDGDNSTCNEVKYEIEAPRAYGYNDLIDVPAHSTSIYIKRQRSGDDLGCLALRTNRMYILNGNYVISKTTTSEIFENIRIDYIIDENKEIIKSVGNFSVPIRVQFLAGSVKQQNNGRINLIYYVPKMSYTKYTSRQTNRNQIQKMSKQPGISSSIGQSQNGTKKPDHQTKWVYHESFRTEGMPCNKMCQGVQRTRIYPVCMINQQRVDDSLCPNEKIKLKYIEKACNTDCRLHIFSSPGRCMPNNGECGAGIEIPILRCIKYELSDSERMKKTGLEVDLKNCDRLEIQRANHTYTRPCQLPCEHYEWRSYESECSVSCGEGHKLKRYECYDLKSNQQVDSSYCADTPRPSTEYLKCNFTCYKWQTSAWSQCSKTCDTGYRTRDIYCVFNSQSIVDKSLCDSNIPSTREECNTDECPVWRVGEWNECSCETSQQNRSVTCYYQNTQVDAARCRALVKPSHLQDCNQKDCPMWKFTEWSNCSSSCGKSVRTRHVYCSTEDSKIISFSSRSDSSRSKNILNSLMKKQSKPIEIDESNCKNLIRPGNVTECENTTECPEWRTGVWTACSVTCGQGIRMRTVQCSSNKPSDCAHLIKPKNSESCKMPSCSAHWQVGNWSECYDGCVLGWKSRSVSCVDSQFNILQHYHCANQLKPINRQRCSSCGTWKASEWSECSVLCGDGYSTRKIECYAEDFSKQLPDNQCDLRKKPEEVRNCSKDCTKSSDEWKIVSVGECSVTCGIGWRLRNIQCLNNGNPSNLCSPELKPEYYEQCDSGECPKWEFGDWSECSASCGEGFKRRLVACRFENGTQLNDSKCKSQDKPSYTTKCNERQCGLWSSGNWSECDLKSCTIFRIVKCILPDGTYISDEWCNKNERPSHISQCTNRIECVKYQKYAISPFEQTQFTGRFVYTNWSRCSVKCGPGVRTREPMCVHNSDKSVQLPFTYCNQNSLEKLKIKCFLANCTFKLIENWSPCSIQCGKRGIETLEQKCIETVTREYHNLSMCGVVSSPNKTRSCFKPCIRHLNLINYEWKTTTWSGCNGSCGFGYKTRSVYCWNYEEKKIVNDSFCSSKKKLISALPCMITSCGYGWFVSKWSSCSKNCSTGFKTREVKCVQISREGHLKNETSNQCSLAEKPVSRVECNYGDCGSNYFWKVGLWSACSPHCGFGHQKRIIECVDKNGLVQDNQQKCNKNSIPISHQLCFTNCHAQSCLQLKNYFGVIEDGDYTLNVTNKLASIYCHGMNTTKPEEFISLKTGQSQNFAEIYDKKLLNPKKCRFGPRYGAFCSFCSNQTVQNHGITLFSKIRINLENLTVISNDFRFAKVQFGSFVPFGTAGDCYSSLPECQQARLNINLRGTNFVIHDQVRWITYGDNAFNRINFSRDKSIAYGTCGGLCGFCHPDPKKGLKLAVV